MEGKPLKRLPGKPLLGLHRPKMRRQGVKVTGFGGPNGANYG